MSPWTHSICAPCWDTRNPGRPSNPALLTAGPLDSCCWCGEETRAGIYTRSDPKVLRCKGEHRAPSEGS